MALRPIARWHPFGKCNRNCKSQNKNFIARSWTARLKTKKLVLAVRLQSSKQKNWRSQSNCKAQNKKIDARSWAARLKIKDLVLAVELHGSK